MNHLIQPRMKDLVMIRPIILFLSVTHGTLNSGCSKDKASNNTPSTQAESSKESANTAATNVKPGSYEDWCDEHQVPESQCTQCNQSLAAAFKATGDWCNEHGLPESQCRKCKPDLKIVRPPKTN